jgi:Prokaryotic E2 family E
MDRHFALPEEDTEALNAEGLRWEAIAEGSKRWVLIHGILLPEKLHPTEVSVAISIPSSYPSAALDMAYFDPAIQRIDGCTIPATQSSVRIREKRWQRWSRHYTTAHPWKTGEYNVVTHLHLVRHWIEREGAK